MEKTTVSQASSSARHLWWWIKYLRHELKDQKLNWIQRLLNPINALWKDLMRYRLNLILNSNQGPAHFR